METPKSILVPIDFSRAAGKAMEYGIMLARQFNAELYLLHIVSDIGQSSVDYALPKDVLDDYKKKSLESSRQKMQDEIGKYPEAKGLKIITEVSVGLPYQEILDAAEKNKIDLIVINTHGRSAILHQIMGSVAERVLRSAKCPVMLIRS
jgi:nucleotide-binding universal stress UspA family protein